MRSSKAECWRSSTPTFHCPPTWPSDLMSCPAATAKPAAKPFEVGFGQPSLRQPHHESRPANAQEKTAGDVAGPMVAGPDTGEAGQHDHDGGAGPQQPAISRPHP